MAWDWVNSGTQGRILVRHWDTPELRESLRITIGSPAQNDALLEALRAIG